MTTQLASYLELASKHLTEVSSSGNQNQITELIKQMNKMSDYTYLSAGVLEWTKKISSFSDAASAKKSLTTYLSQDKFKKVDPKDINHFVDRV